MSSLTFAVELEREDELFSRLSRIEAVITEVKNLEMKMAGELDTLRAEVAEAKSVMESSRVLIVGLKEKLDAAGTDAAALKALSDELDAKTNELAAAVQANTPQA